MTREDRALGKGTGMEARPSADDLPPPRDLRPPHDVVGADALSPLLAHARFPTDKEGLVAQLGDVQIPVGRERTRRLSEILDDVAPETFGSAADVEAAIGRLWDKVAEREGRGGRHPERADLTERARDDRGPEGGLPRERFRRTNE